MLGLLIHNNNADHKANNDLKMIKTFSIQKEITENFQIPEDHN